MRFTLSTQMLMVLAVAIGCVGWRLGVGTMANMLSSESMLTALGMMLLSAIQILILVAQGKAKTLPFILLGIATGLIAIGVRTGWHAFGRNPMVLPLCLPTAALAGSIRNAFLKDLSQSLRTILLLLACFPAGWFSSVVFHHP